MDAPSKRHSTLASGSSQVRERVFVYPSHWSESRVEIVRSESDLQHKTRHSLYDNTRRWFPDWSVAFSGNFSRYFRGQSQQYSVNSNDNSNHQYARQQFFGHIG